MLRRLTLAVGALAALALPAALAQAPPISLIDSVTQDRGLNCAGPIISYRNNIFVAGREYERAHDGGHPCGIVWI